MKDDLLALEAQLLEAHHDIEALEDENAQLRAALLRADAAIEKAIHAVEATEAGLTRIIDTCGS